MADLVAEFSKPLVEIVAKEWNMDEKSVEVISTPGPPCWKVYVAQQIKGGPEWD